MCDAYMKAWRDGKCGDFTKRDQSVSITFFAEIFGEDQIHRLISFLNGTVFNVTSRSEPSKMSKLACEWVNSMTGGIRIKPREGIKRDNDNFAFFKGGCDDELQITGFSQGERFGESTVWKLTINAGRGVPMIVMMEILLLLENKPNGRLGCGAVQIISTNGFPDEDDRFAWQNPLSEYAWSYAA